MSGISGLLTLLSALLACRAVHTLPAECVFPEHWRGTWYQYRVGQDIRISETEVSSKGNCTIARQHRYVVHNNVGRCYMCVVFYEKHVNVIQYKESFCSPDSEPPDHDFLCSHVTGDVQLYSMFRVNYRPIACPLRGPFRFSYSRGHMLQQDCSQPNSRLERCIHDFRMLFRYQACVASAEESVEEMECLGMWKEGSQRYLVTRRVSPSITRLEDAFRCFIYERAKPQEQSLLDYRLAESAEATCSGLYSTSDGNTRLSLQRVASATTYNRCRFPVWATIHHRWHSLDRRTTYQFNRNATSLTVTGSPEEVTRLECDRVVSESTRRALLVVRSITGCVGGYQCMAFYRRDGHVMESQLGTVTQEASEACSHFNFARHQADYRTLVSSSQHHVACPHLGQYSVTGLSRSTRDPDEPGDRDERAAPPPEFSALRVGCQSDDTIVLAASVGDQSRAFSCHGSWQENDTFYLVASPRRRSRETARHYCFVYTMTADNVRFSRVMRTCSRAVRPGVEGELAFNVTARAECLTGSARRWQPLVSPLLLSAAAAVLVRR